MRSRLSPILFVLLLSTLSFGQFGYPQGGYRLRMKTTAEYAALQRQLVGSYCRLDFEGSRLSEDGWAKIKPLVRFKQNADFNVVEVVSRYQVSPPEGQASNFVTVSYSVLGRYEIGFGYTAAPNTHDVTFRVEEKDNALDITDVEPSMPRVSKRAAIQWLKTQLQQSTNSIAKSQIEKALAQLEEPAAAPAAAEPPK